MRAIKRSSLMMVAMAFIMVAAVTHAALALSAAGKQGSKSNHGSPPQQQHNLIGLLFEHPVLCVFCGFLLTYLAYHRQAGQPRRPRPWPPPVEVFETSDGRGKGLRSTKAFKPGDVILVEPPLLRWPRNGPVAEMVPIRAYLRLRQREQAAVLGLYCPGELSPDGWGSLVGVHGENLDELLEVSGLSPQNIPKDLRETLCRLLAVADANSATGTNFSAIYELFSRMNHSCLPNVCTATKSSGEIAMVAAFPIERGEELCTEYVDADPVLPLQDLLVLPTALRRARLRRWGFKCTCPRCSALYDPERAFACKACGTGRCVVEHLSTDGPERLAACGSCGVIPADEEVGFRLGEEVLLAAAAEQDIAPRLAKPSQKTLASIRALLEACAEEGVQLATTHWLTRWLEALLCSAQSSAVPPVEGLEQLAKFFKVREQTRAHYGDTQHC